MNWQQDWMAQSLEDDLLKEADREARLAEEFRGCSFVGEHPSAPHGRRAGLLRLAAAVITRKRRK